MGLKQEDTGRLSNLLRYLTLDPAARMPDHCPTPCKKWLPGLNRCRHTSAAKLW